MSFGVPSSKLDASQMTAIRLSARDALSSAVVGVIGQSVVIRPIQAFDISGAASAAALYSRLSNKNATVARTWLVNDFGYRQVPVNTAIAIYSYIPLQAAPVLDAIRFTNGPIPLVMLALAEAYADEYSAELYIDPPVVWRALQNIGIDYLSETAIAANGESYALGGFVCEPVGQNVQPDQANLA